MVGSFGLRAMPLVAVSAIIAKHDLSWSARWGVIQSESMDCGPKARCKPAQGKRGTSAALGDRQEISPAPTGRNKTREAQESVAPRWGFACPGLKTQGGAPASLALGWLVSGPWPELHWTHFESHPARCHSARRVSYCLFMTPWCVKCSKMLMRILIADDEKKFAELLVLMVLDAGHEVAGVVTSGGLGAMHAYSECEPDVVLMDFRMPQFNGVTATRHILSKDTRARVVLISGLPDTSELQLAASDAGAMGVLQKPFSQTELEDLLAILPFASVHMRAARQNARSLDSVQRSKGDGAAYSKS
jgi:two-component system chemotaxis response regulator CheY